MGVEQKRPAWLNYEHLADAVPGGVIAFDVNGRTIYVNQRTMSLLGMDREDLLGLTLEELTTSDWADVARMHLRKAGKGERATFDFCFVKRKGGESWARVSMTPAFESGDYVGAVAILADISSERRVEGQLREAELRLREAAAHMPGIIYELRQSHSGELRIEYISEAVKDYIGVDADTLMLERQPISRYLHPDDAALIASKAAKPVGSLHSSSIEVRLLHGEITHHLYTASSIAQADNGRLVVTGVAIDVGDLRRTENQLRASQAQLHAVFDNFPFECWTLDLEGRFLLQNPFCERRWGHLQGKTIRAVELPDETLDDWQEDIDTARSGKVASRDLIVTMDGRRNHFARLIVPILDGEEVLGVLGVAMDTTEQRRLEDQLARAQKLDAIGRLAGGIAHDFNNVLTAIMSCVRLLERRLEGPPRRELQIIRDGAQRAAELTRQLLAFAKQEMVEPRRTAVDEIVLKSDRLLRRLIGEDIELVTLAGCKGWEVVVDPVRLEQAIINLVVNARDAMPRGGKISVRCECIDVDESLRSVDGVIPPGRYALILVEDSGVGMSEETKARAFEPFFTTRQESGGTGLGLSSVYGSVHQADGYVTLDSHLNQGTTVGLYLPRAEQRLVTEVTPEHDPRVRDHSAGGSETILLVEDEPLVMSVACQSLRLSGYTVLQARSTQDALKVARNYKGAIDLLLTDVVMPHGSGTELAVELRKERPEISVLFMSGYTSDRIDVEVDKVAFLAKPFTPERLDAQVREVLDAARA